MRTQWMSVTSLVVAATLAAAFAAPVAATGLQATATKAPTVTIAPTVTTTPTATHIEPYFDFRVGMWSSLHHFLYVLGRAQEGVPDARRAAVAGAPDDIEGFDRLSAERQAAWHDAIAFYRAGLSQRDAVFNTNLIRVGLVMARAGDADGIAGVRSADPSGWLDDEVAAVLERVAPIYREVWWDRHRAGVERRISEWNELLEVHGPALIGRLSDIYRLSWPADGVAIEAVAYSNWAGAYSTGTDDEALIVMSALYGGNERVQGIESALHESLHQGNAVDQTVRRLARQHDLEIHDWLTHGLIFYTTGEIVRERVPGHVPNGEAFGVWDRVGPELPAVFEAHWGPYMASETSMEEALLALLRALQ